MTHYKSALEIGDVIKLNREFLIGANHSFEKGAKVFEKGSEVKVIEKNKYVLTAEDKNGRKITWLLGVQNPDYYVQYVGKQFSE